MERYGLSWAGEGLDKEGPLGLRLLAEYVPDLVDQWQHLPGLE